VQILLLVVLGGELDADLDLRQVVLGLLGREQVIVLLLGLGDLLLLKLLLINVHRHFLRLLLLLMVALLLELVVAAFEGDVLLLHVLLRVRLLGRGKGGVEVRQEAAAVVVLEVGEVEEALLKAAAIVVGGGKV
jgi:hypothetical protein